LAVSSIVDQARAGRGNHRRLFQRGGGLFARVFVANASVMVIAFLVLAFTPVSVNRTATVDQVAVLSAGLVAMLAANAALLRVSLAPLRRLTQHMHKIDVLRPAAPLDASGSAEIADVISAFGLTVQRLEEERRTSTRRVIHAQEAERRRIAQELHDQIGQNLTAVVLELKRARGHLSGQAIEMVTDAQEMARESLDELRRISYQLRPVALDDLGLQSALAALCSGVSRRTGIAITHDLATQLPPLDQDEELAVYRVAQEALTNAVRHAACSTIEVTLQPVDDALTLSVLDDGQGISGTPGRLGGVRGMRERALMIGADLRVQNGRAGGVEVELRMPTSPKRP
jgi:two-component system, NarL family, sensor histidine kinase UhpB